MRKYLLIILSLWGCTKNPPEAQPELFPVSKTTQDKEIKRVQVNSDRAMEAPYVLLISLDGYKYDYTEKYKVESLNDFQVTTPYMIPSFPSKTFPNHYSIVTGMYPGNHGLVSNTFYDREKAQTYQISDRSKVEDPSWYLGTPLWVLATGHDMVSASMFWVGSEAPIQGVYPTYFYKYDAKISHEDRVNQVLRWLSLPAEERPHLITLYFSFIDSIGHSYGPDSDEIREAVQEVDVLMADLMDKIKSTQLPVNVVVVSDHGMMEIAQEKQINISPIIDPEEINVTFNMPVMVYSDDEQKMQEAFEALQEDERLDVYKKDNLPDRFHYNLKSRIGDLVIMPKPSYVVTSRDFIPEPGNSTHGWDPAASKHMGAIFYASGPAFRENYVVEPFENIHVYPLIAQILGLSIDHLTIDGQMEVLQETLRPN